MAHRTHTFVPISEIHELATRFDADEIALCQERVLRGKDNVCYSDPNPDEVMKNVLKGSRSGELLKNLRKHGPTCSVDKEYPGMIVWTYADGSVRLVPKKEYQV